MENEIENRMESEAAGPVREKKVTKDKVILFVIGVLVGAVLATAAFFIYVKVAGVGVDGGEQSMQMPGGDGGTPPEMPSGEMPDGEGGTPPEMPSGEMPDGEGGTPPELPDGESGTPPEKPEGESEQSDQNSQSRRAKPSGNSNNS